MLIDWSVSVGNIINMMLLIVGALMFFLNLKNEIRSLRFGLKQVEVKQEALSDAFKQLGVILTQVAVQDTRLQMIEKSVDELRHGQGYVKA